MKYILQLLVFIGVLFNYVAADVVVSCKPIYFVVAPLLKGLGAPKLILNHGQCGHHHHLKPSEVQLIKSAKIIFWNGSVHEPFMSKMIEASQSNIKVFDEKDGFSWLSPADVIKKIPAIVDALKSLYPESNHATLNSNATSFVAELRTLDEKTRVLMQSLKERAVLTTYPFLTYFANAYGVKVSGYMMGSPEESVTPQRLRNVYKILEEKQVIGVVKDHHVPLNMVQSLTQRYNLPILTVDAEGVDIPLSINGYNILIERIAQSIVKWAK